MPLKVSTRGRAHAGVPRRAVEAGSSVPTAEETRLHEELLQLAETGTLGRGDGTNQ